MKKILYMSVLLVFLGVTGVYTATVSTFKGLVIDTANASFEIKKGHKQITVYWTDQSKVVKDGKEVDRNAVEICQRVKATYTFKDGRRELVTLDILTDSYCFR